MRISDWSSDVCSSDLADHEGTAELPRRLTPARGIRDWGFGIAQSNTGAARKYGGSFRIPKPHSRLTDPGRKNPNPRTRPALHAADRASNVRAGRLPRSRGLVHPPGRNHDVPAT